MGISCLDSLLLFYKYQYIEKIGDVENIILSEKEKDFFQNH